jgi:hypothetical protein
MRGKGNLVDWRTNYKGQRARCFHPAVDGLRGSAIRVVAGGITSHHRSLRRAQEAATDRLFAAARWAKFRKAEKERLKGQPPPGTFYLYAVRGGPTAKVWFRSASRSRSVRTSMWALTIEEGKLYTEVGQARAQRTKLLRSHPDMAPIEVVCLVVKLGDVVTGG